jgi:hypothetical protein
MKTIQGSKMMKADLHRQVDAKGFVFASREAASTWGVAPSSPRGLTADAFQNSTQSRIFRIDCQELDHFKASCCRIFIDPIGKDNHRSASRHVPLGQALPHGYYCWRTP